MSVDYRELFQQCGDGVVIEAEVHIEHPELFRVGDNVRLGRGFYARDAPTVTLGSNVEVYPGCFVQGTGELTVADDVEFFPHTVISTGGDAGFTRIDIRSHFAAGCALYGSGGLTVGAYCNVAAHVVLATIEHDPTRGDGPMAWTVRKAPIVLEDDVWLGANASVPPGTTIARGCVIGAGAVVTHDTEPYGIYVGVPARRIRDR